MRLRGSLGWQILEIMERTVSRSGKTWEILGAPSHQSPTQMVQILSVYCVQAITQRNPILKHQNAAFTETFLMLIPTKYLTLPLCTVITCLVICQSLVSAGISGCALDSLLKNKFHSNQWWKVWVDIPADIFSIPLQGIWLMLLFSA